MKEVIWLACMKCHTTYQIWGQEEIFSQRLVETVKVFAFLWRRELNMVNLKTPAQPSFNTMDFQGAEWSWVVDAVTTVG